MLLRFAVRRLLLLVPILLGLSILVFLWIRALPGSPAESLLGERATPEAVAELRRSVRARRSDYRFSTGATSSRRSGTWISERASASFRPVTDRDRREVPGNRGTRARGDGVRDPHRDPARLPRCEEVRSVFDHASLITSLIGISIPIFFLGLILKYIFAVRLGWLPSIGREDVLAEDAHPTNFYLLDAVISWDWVAFWDAVKHLILPGDRARLDSARDRGENHARGGARRAERGLRPHGTGERARAPRRRLPPRAAQRASAGHRRSSACKSGLLLSGAILTETVFAWPGIGTWLKAAIFEPRLPGHPGRHALRGDRLRSRQPGRRHLVRDPQSTHPAGGR